MDNRTTETLVAKYEALLLKSIRIYREVAQCYDSLQTAAEQLSDGIGDALAVLNTLFDEAKIVEVLLLENIPASAELPPSCIGLIEKRLVMLTAVHAANRSLTARATSAHALLRHELAASTTGRTALKGYRPTDLTRPGMLSGSC